MAILIDPPRWPAWGTVFSHLVSDSSLEELHAFARANGVPAAAFDHDHYDVPERMYEHLVAAGALAVRETELIRRLIRGGMRVRATDRTPKRRIAEQRAREAWQQLMPEHRSLGEELLERWGEEHRHYHDVRHLVVALDALEQLGEADPSVQLAVWFHDAVYDGVPGQDEESSARLAQERLQPILPADQVAQVARLVRLTATHAPAPDDHAGARLVDADLSILGANPGRYDVYTRDVRLDYEHIDEPTFVAGRLQVVTDLLGRDQLFHTARGRELWQEQARMNLAREAANLRERLNATPSGQ